MATLILLEIHKQARWLKPDNQRVSPYICCWLNIDIIFATLNYRYTATVVTPEHHLRFWISIHRAFQYDRIPLGCHCDTRCCDVWVV